MYIHICIYIYTYTYMYVFLLVGAAVAACKFISLQLLLPATTCAFVFKCVCTDGRLECCLGFGTGERITTNKHSMIHLIYIYTRIYICIYTYIYTYMYIHI